MNRFLKMSMLSCVFTAMLVVLLLRTGIAEAASPLNCGSWNIVSSPNPGGANYLEGVATVSTSDVWAVGYIVNSTEETLIEHWNGTSWSVVSSPNPGSGQNVLRAVAVISTSDVWAVGYSYPDANSATLIEHWDGTSWSAVPSPNGGLNNDLYGVAAISTSDVWAVGLIRNSSNITQTLTEHWDGSSWSVVSSPNPGTQFSYLEGVAAISTSDVWAVGQFTNTGSHSQTLTEHWDGSSWSVVSSPNAGGRGNDLHGVARVPSASRVWAVGDSAAKSGISTLTERWNGTNWRIVSSPNADLRPNHLQGVAAATGHNVWAVGYYENQNGYVQTLIEHWNGTQWSIAASSNLIATLQGVAHVPGSSQFWAVGAYYTNNTTQTLIEFYC